MPGNPSFSNDNIRLGPVNNACYSKRSFARGDMVDPYLVRTGTSCGSGQVSWFYCCISEVNFYRSTRYTKITKRQDC